MADSSREDSSDSFKRARDLLIGAVDTVIKIAAREKDRPATQTEQECSSQSSAGSSIAEHRRLFGFQPSKLGKKPVSANKRSTFRRAAAPAQRPKPGRNTWKKDCICLRDREQEVKPTPEEKMELAKMGLGLAEVVFSNNGNAEHNNSQPHNSEVSSSWVMWWLLLPTPWRKFTLSSGY